MSYLRRALTITAKDLRLEWRRLEKVASMIFFAVLLLVILHLSFDFVRLGFTELGAGVLWVCISFAGIAGLGHSFVQEREGGCLESLMLCPGDRSAVYLGKFLSNMVFVLVVEVVVLPLAAFLFDTNVLPVLLPLSAVMLLYTIGFVALGTLFAAMSTATRRGGVLLSVLLFPFLLPGVMTSIRAAGRLLAGWTASEVANLIVVTVAYDVAVFVVSLLVFPYVIEE